MRCPVCNSSDAHHCENLYACEVYVQTLAFMRTPEPAKSITMLVRGRNFNMHEPWMRMHRWYDGTATLAKVHAEKSRIHAKVKASKDKTALALLCMLLNVHTLWMREQQEAAEAMIVLEASGGGWALPSPKHPRVSALSRA